MTLAQKAARYLLSFLLILSTMPAGMRAGTQSAPTSGDQGNYAPLAPEDLDNLVAPIALYPDALVAQVLGAATFPDQVTDANNWLKLQNTLCRIESWVGVCKTSFGFSFLLLNHSTNRSCSGVVTYFVT